MGLLENNITYTSRQIVHILIMQEWDYYVPKGLRFTRACFSSHLNIRIVKLLKSRLSAVQLDMFQKTGFGHFLNMPPILVQNLVLPDEKRVGSGV